MQRENRRRHFRQGARGRGSFAAGTFPVCLVHDGVLRPPRRQARLDKQLHLGALRNTNSRLLKQLGPDTGFDSIGDFPQCAALAAYLDRLDSDNLLPKTIIYNLNPADNYAFAAMIGNFQDGTVPGKIQYGSGWWFLDQKEGMEMAA